MMHKPAMVNFNRRGSCGIVDSKEEPVVEYKCDAGDKPVGARTLTTVYDALAETGPFRYRGYACDEGMGLYPLQNRCYNPDWGSFINRDNLFTANLCMYCQNNPDCFDGQDGSSARTGTRARELYCTAINLSKEKSRIRRACLCPILTVM